MDQVDYEAAVPKELADLIPTFLENRKKDIAILRSAFAEANLEQLRSVGHRMKGIGASYGFHAVTTLGKQIEDSAKAGALKPIAALLEAYDSYLANVRITFV